MDRDTKIWALGAAVGFGIGMAVATLSVVMMALSNAQLQY